MTIDQARRWIVVSSLLGTGGVFVFFLLSPLFHYPLEYKDAFKIFEIVLPVFLGYLGSAAHFLFKPQDQLPRLEPNQALFSLMVKWPIVIFGITGVCALIAFGVTNARTAPAGTGMSVSTLATIFSVALGVLAVTTNVLSSYLFAVESRDAGAGQSIPTAQPETPKPQINQA